MTDTDSAGVMNQPSQCWSCRAFLSPDQQDEDGFHCPNCGDEPSATELEMNGWHYDAERGVWASE